MPGRKDFGILRSSFYSDDRAQRAAEIYTARGLAREDIAFAAVAGHIVQLGLWAMLQTDDGVLPRDGVAAMHDATRMPRSACQEVVVALSEAGLLRPVEGGIYLVGFVECYEPIVGRRIEQARRKREQRERDRLAKESVTPTSPHVTPTSHADVADGHADVTPTNGEVTPTSRGHVASVGSSVTPTSPHVTPRARADRAVPCRALPAVPNPTMPSDATANGHGGGVVSASPSPNGNGTAEPRLAADDLVIATEIARALRSSDVPSDRSAGDALWSALRDESATPDAIERFVDRWQHAPNIVDVVTKHRRLLAMTRNGRKTR